MGKVLAAELLGTFWLVFGGCGSAVLAAAFPGVGIGLLGVSLAFGLTVLTMAYAIGHISGLPPEPGGVDRAVRSAGASRRRECCPTSWRRSPARSLGGGRALRDRQRAAGLLRSPAGWPPTATPSTRPAATRWWRASSPRSS